MKKWEYEVITVQATNIKGDSPFSITHVLNEAGAQGGELVRMELRPMGLEEFYECILKREKKYYSSRSDLMN